MNMNNANNENNIKRRVIRLLPMIMMMVLIFIFSAMPGDDSSNTSSKFLEPILKVVEGVSHHDIDLQTEETLHFLLRKFAHFSEYALLGMLVINGFYSKTINLVKLGIISELVSVLYASSDEFHQLFVEGRCGAVKDVIIDSSGALTGILLLLLIINTVRKKNKKRVEG